MSSFEVMGDESEARNKSKDTTSLEKSGTVRFSWRWLPTQFVGDRQIWNMTADTNKHKSKRMGQNSFVEQWRHLYMISQFASIFSTK